MFLFLLVALCRGSPMEWSPVHEGPAGVRTLARDGLGRLVGVRVGHPIIDGSVDFDVSAVEVWISPSGDGTDWFRSHDAAVSSTVWYRDPTIIREPVWGLVLVAFAEQKRDGDHAGEHAIRMRGSRDNGATWTTEYMTIIDWAGRFTAAEGGHPLFVGAPFLLAHPSGTVTVYYDTEAMPYRAGMPFQQWIGLRHATDLYNGVFGDEIVASREQSQSKSFSRDGLASVVPLGQDRVLVVTEGVAEEKYPDGRTSVFNVVRGQVAANYGTEQADWDFLGDRFIIYQSSLRDSNHHRYNAYSPFAFARDDGQVIVAFSTDEFLYDSDTIADASDAPVHLRHSSIKFVCATGDSFEPWSAPETLFLPALGSADVHNYHIGLVQGTGKNADKLYATVDFFGGRQVIYEGKMPTTTTTAPPTTTTSRVTTTAAPPLLP